jgi:hypothetical protein
LVTSDTNRERSAFLTRRKLREAGVEPNVKFPLRLLLALYRPGGAYMLKNGTGPKAGYHEAQQFDFVSLPLALVTLEALTRPEALGKLPAGSETVRALRQWLADDLGAEWEKFRHAKAQKQAGLRLEMPGYVDANHLARHAAQLGRLPEAKAWLGRLHCAVERGDEALVAELAAQRVG